MVLADRLVVIEDGAVVQEGAPAEVARRPRTDYVARLVGLNLYRGVADGHAGRGRRTCPSASPSPLDGAGVRRLPPAAVALYRTRPDGSPRNLWQATIEGIERHGDNVRVHLDGPITASPTSPPPPSPTST